MSPQQLILIFIFHPSSPRVPGPCRWMEAPTIHRSLSQTGCVRAPGSRSRHDIFSHGLPGRPKPRSTSPTGGHTSHRRQAPWETPPIGEKRVGSLGSPPRQPALEELIIQVDYELEDFPGGLLPRKPPRGELPTKKLFEFKFGASLPVHVSLALTPPIPGNGSRQRRPPPGKSRGLRRFSGGRTAPTEKIGGS
jgi:hypothetical protein